MVSHVLVAFFLNCVFFPEKLLWADNDRDMYGDNQTLLVLSSSTDVDIGADRVAPHCVY